MATAASRRFNWSVSKRTVALGLGAAATVTAAIIVSLPHGESAQRKALVAYIDSIDNVEGRMTFPMTKVLHAYQAFAHQKSITPRTQAQLGQAETTVKSLRRQLAAIPAPPDARPLRADVLRLVTSEAEITHEVHLLALFVPPFAAAVARVHGAGLALGKTLAAIKPPTAHLVRGTKKQIAKARAAFASASDRTAAAEADAIDAYDAIVKSAIARVRRLSAPPAFTPALRSELHGLQAIQTAGGRLAGVLRSSSRSNVAELGRAFTVATRRSESAPAQRAEIAAVKAYDARVRRLSRFTAAVQQDVSSLQQAVR